MPRRTRNAIEVIDETYRYPRRPKPKGPAKLSIRMSTKDLERMVKRAEREEKSVQQWALDTLLIVARAGQNWDMVTWTPLRAPRKRKGTRRTGQHAPSRSR